MRHSDSLTLLRGITPIFLARKMLESSIRHVHSYVLGNFIETRRWQTGNEKAVVVSSADALDQLQSPDSLAQCHPKHNDGCL